MNDDFDRYARLSELVAQARLLGGDELEQFLSRACGSDVGLLDEARQLLELGHRDATGELFAEEQLEGLRGNLEAVLEGSSTAWVPERIGDYRIVRQLGQGGMGVVYEAEQAAPRRRVAIKLLHPLQATPERLRRFQHEVALLGQLQHPGIARIYAASTFDVGRGPQPFFAMELVEGVDIRSYCEQEQLDREQRLALLAEVADIVHYAHERDIVHRDLKPDNILVDQHGRPRVLDFGIAHAGAASTDLSTALTKDGQLIGTLAYMAPERLNAEGGLVTPGVDVFALGVIGFELLLGRFPRRTTDGELAAHIAQLARSEPLRAGALDTALRGDVDTILGKALETHPSRRYASAAAFAGDIRRCLAKEPIQARPPSALYRFDRFLHRNRTLAAGAAATLVVTAVGAWIATDFGLDASRRAEELETRVEDFERLSALQEHDALLARVETLWPPHPAEIPRLEAWIEDAESLVATRGELEAKRAELRALALPRTDAERERDREEHPRFAELGAARGELLKLERALAQRVDGIGVALPEVNWKEQPSDFAGLHTLARRLIHPARSSFGEEPFAAVIAERAFGIAPPEERWYAAVTLALAYFELGREEDALSLTRRVAGEASGETRAARERAIASLELGSAAARSDEGIGRQVARIELLTGLVEELEQAVNQRRSWTRFPPEVEAERRASWWLGQLDGLLADLDALSAPGAPMSAAGVDPTYGWGVPRRLAFARELEAGFAPGGGFRERWNAALPELQPTYPGLDLQVQMGIVPLGPDPDSGLWEFWHVQSGSEPRRDAAGTLEIDDATGVVLVLLPATNYRRGAQVARATRAWNEDPDSRADEAPVHEVQLSAFFLAKYELTQSQWLRAMGTSPSRWSSETPSEDWLPGPHPVESISYTLGMEALARLGLTFPSEAQWEYACRAGSTTPRPFSGDELVGSANVADLSFQAQFRSATIYESWDDGAGVHRPVGQLKPNPLGLHDMIGNVAEWCLDGYQADFYRKSSPLDPVRPALESEFAVHRGGSFASPAAEARSSARGRAAKAFGEAGHGVRPARRVQP